MRITSLSCMNKLLTLVLIISIIMSFIGEEQLKDPSKLLESQKFNYYMGNLQTLVLLSDQYEFKIAKQKRVVVLPNT